MSLKYSAFGIPANVSELSDKIQRKGFERKVDLTVLMHDDFHNFGKIPGLLFTGKYNLRACLITDYSGLVTAHDNPEVFLLNKLGEVYWGLITKQNRESYPMIIDVKKNLNLLIQQIQENRLEIDQISIPGFLIK